MLKVWADNLEAGVVARSVLDDKQFTFTYQPDAPPSAAVSLTMPVGSKSYPYPNGLHPIFQMNLPEGRLKESIERRVRKLTPDYDELSLLEITGPSQIGRLRYGSHLDHPAFQTQSIAEILTYDGAEDLFQDLLNRFAEQSGISGVQPKVLIRDDAYFSGDGRKSLTMKSATHIVKSWDANEFPELAANEYFCLQVAKKAGLPIPEVALSDNGKLLVVTRFDLSPEGAYLGFEDFCVLTGLPTQDKYSLSYERVAKGIRQFVSPTHRSQALAQFFTALLVNCAVQNGDAHLKNFGILYADPFSSTYLAPIYDVVSTSPYLPRDVIALTLDGRKSYPSAKVLSKFAQQACGIAPRTAKQLMEKVADAVSDTLPDLIRYGSERPDFAPIGKRIVSAWEAGTTRSLQTK
ncbi:type II toxin-antitoxin system HipA family toxin [Leeia sp. TBRC 13508]|uniref:Type II toxin-antitoxin system HipA family toxin n=1 Tax=Leeia speluncae TaxID=2884804 RepID=A0ABS8D9Q3_9NEIS|nr:type II toxin-antitoxin system HipA family toxin [Leeia speluncae]MCB6184909.1 type II toxin-antitoxin system HipA family toxin [Leeia speluncae]